MASYDIEHNVPAPTKSAHSQRRRPRPDLDTFYSSLSLVDTSAVQNANATPIPADVAASYRLLSEGMQAMMRDNPDQALTERLTEFLMQRAEMPPERIDGVPDEFIDGLERVPKKRLKKSDDCPICGNAFLEDEYPLVVRLPCNDKHIFDLECIQPWLKLNSTCPLDRKRLAEKKPPPPKEKDEDEEEYDEMYG